VGHLPNLEVVTHYWPNIRRFVLDIKQMLRKEIGEIFERGNNSKREFGVEPQLGFEEIEHASMTPRTPRREMQDMRTIGKQMQSKQNMKYLQLNLRRSLVSW
jgi:hypothetical protein